MKLPGKRCSRAQHSNLKSQLTSESYYKETLSLATVEHISQELKDIFSEQLPHALKSSSLVPWIMLRLVAQLCMTPGDPTRLLCPRGFSRQEYSSGQPIPSPGDLPDPGIEPASPALQVDSLPAELPGKSTLCHVTAQIQYTGRAPCWHVQTGFT